MVCCSRSQRQKFMQVYEYFGIGCLCVLYIWMLLAVPFTLIRWCYHIFFITQIAERTCTAYYNYKLIENENNWIEDELDEKDRKLLRVRSLVGVANLVLVSVLFKYMRAYFSLFHFRFVL